MRLRDPERLHLMGLYALPVLVAWLGWGVGAALAASALMLIAGIAVQFRAMRLATTRPDTAPLRLHTISFSHYVEKVRWCMDRLGLDYEEVPNVGILGVLLTGRTVPSLEVAPGFTRIGDSPRILRYLWGEYSGRLPTERTRFLEPGTQALELEQKFDRRLGIDVRIWAYAHILKRRDLALRSWGIAEPAIPGWQRALLRVMAPLLRLAVRRMLGVTPGRAVVALERTRQAFDEVDSLLADGRRYLLGDELSFADITFASLAALAVVPPEFAGRSLRSGGFAIEDLDAGWRAEVEDFRRRPAGQFVLRLYREERLVQAH
jgi:glutathione S-transferase